MKLFKGILIFIGAGLLASCIKHEVIPAPEPRVDLPANFTAKINGAGYELIKDVDGVHCVATQALEILPSPQPSNVIYFSSIESSQKLDLVKVSLGKLNFNPNENTKPSVAEFKTFFELNQNPSFQIGGEGGVEIVYRDASGNVWMSMEDSGMPQSFVITSLSQESDELGDYMLFTAQFSVTLYDDIEDPTDAILIEDAIYKGYFKR